MGNLDGNQERLLKGARVSNPHELHCGLRRLEVKSHGGFAADSHDKAAMKWTDEKAPQSKGVMIPCSF
jgi:hypothetical protein